MTNAESRLAIGRAYPWDASDAFWEDSGPGPKDGDWAIAAARGIIAELRDRRNIKHIFEDVFAYDEGVRAEIVQEMANIIRTASVTMRDIEPEKGKE